MGRDGLKGGSIAGVSDGSHEWPQRQSVGNSKLGQLIEPPLPSPRDCDKMRTNVIKKNLREGKASIGSWINVS